ncbi:MAG: helix-turn-helix transcriptional regulator [Clostridia bacterium]|nr:helix-turn-helix transcriptional regulator [Clostridia bacterium]
MSKKNQKTIGENLREQRELAGLSQMDLSFQTKLSQQAISLWERDERVPNIKACITLANFYGISLDELVGRS